MKFELGRETKVTRGDDDVIVSLSLEDARALHAALDKVLKQFAQEPVVLCDGKHGVHRNK